MTEKEAAAVAGRRPISELLKRSTGFAPAQEVTEDSLIEFSDYPRLRQELFDRVLDSTTKAFPVKNNRYTLEAEDIRYDGPERFSHADHRKAIVENRSLTRKLTGRLKLVDNATGKVVTRASRKTLANIPYLTDQGTYVRNGIEYAVPRQLRMRPGIYTHFTADGYPEAQFNIKPGTGMGFRTWMDPESSIFYLTIGGRKVPMYPVLKEMGVDDRAIQGSWGESIFKANQETQRSPHAARWLNELKAKQEARLAPKPEPAWLKAAPELPDVTPEVLNEEPEMLPEE